MDNIKRKKACYTPLSILLAKSTNLNLSGLCLDSVY